MANTDARARGTTSGARYILAIDQGTTGSTALVVTLDGKTLGRHTTEFPQHFPKPGWVEHDLSDIWKSVGTSVTGALLAAKVDGKDIAAIGITNQRETTVVWDRATREPIHRAIVHRLMQSHTARGATVLRGIWGFHGDHKPHGDKLFQLSRKVPSTTIIVDTPEAIARSFDIVDELTIRHGLVTSEMVPAAMSLDDSQRTTETPLAEYDY